MSVLPSVAPGDLLDRLSPEPPGSSSSQEEILADFERLIFPHLVHWNHPGFMAYFASSGSAPGVLAEALSAALNNVGLLWKSSPALAELEERTVQWLLRAAGLPQHWFGMIHDTASTGTLHAMVAARERAAARALDSGSALDLNRVVTYTSEQAHSSVEKAMAALGQGAQACRKIPCDSRYAMRPGDLDQAIVADRRAGLTPIAVTATIGTTASAGVDPVAAIGKVAASHRLWLHVDAAYAGAAALLPELRHHFTDCDLADSFVLNPHKWLFVPADCSVLYTASPRWLRRALSLVPEYLSSRAHSRAVNFMECAIPLGRRFRALKLWYVLRSFGVDGLRSALREHIRLARLLAGWVDDSENFERLAPVEFGLVCFRYRPGGRGGDRADAASRALLEAVNATGEFFLSHADLGNRYAIRAAIGNVRSGEAHVRRLWELLNDLAVSRGA